MASFTGEATHLMSTRTGPVAKAYSRLQATVFRRTKGRLWKRFLGRPAGRSSWLTSSAGPAVSPGRSC
jgi:hypothetical protein